MAVVKNNCFSEKFFCFLFFSPLSPWFFFFFPSPTVCVFGTIFCYIFPEKTRLFFFFKVYLCFQVPACITGDHDPNSKKVVLRHFLLRDDPYGGPLRVGG